MGKRGDVEEEDETDDIINLKKKKNNKVAEEEDSSSSMDTKIPCPQSRQVLVLNLPLSIDKSELIQFFKPAGRVVGGNFTRPGFNGRCYVRFETKEAADKATELDGRKFCNRNIRVLKKAGMPKTLVAKNLSPPSITRSDVVEFFKQAGEIVDVRFPSSGHCFIEFATEQVTKKAAELNGKYLLGRRLVLGFTHHIIFVKGFDTSLHHDQIYSSLEELFSTCGKVALMTIPTIPYTGVTMGWAYIEYFDARSCPKALAMNGCKLGDSILTIEEAPPLQFDIKPRGCILSIPRDVGPCKNVHYPQRGFAGAGIGKSGSIYHCGSGQKTKFCDDDELTGGGTADDDLTGGTGRILG